MKKIVALGMSAMMVLGLAACSGTDDAATTTAASNDNTKAAVEATTVADAETAGTVEAGAMDDVKVGLICLHDENSTYDLNFINGLKEAATNLGLSDDQIVIKTNIPETSDCYEAALDLVDAGCDIIFADSFGHEQFILQAAEQNPDVEFCHATGTLAHTEEVANFHNAFASIYEGRYLAGVAAGLKLNEMIDAGKITADFECNPLAAPFVEEVIQTLQSGGSPEKEVYMVEHWYALPDAIVDFSINGEAQEMTEVTDAVIEAQY